MQVLIIIESIASGLGEVYFQLCYDVSEVFHIPLVYYDLLLQLSDQTLSLGLL